MCVCCQVALNLLSCLSVLAEHQSATPAPTEGTEQALADPPAAAAPPPSRDDAQMVHRFDSESAGHRTVLAREAG